MVAWLIPIQVFSCFTMTGVIWLVQILVYPNFRFFPAESFGAFHQFHSYRITLLVGPIMLAELVSALLLLLNAGNAVYLVNFGSVFLLWMLTALLSVPLHRRLELDPGSEKSWLSQSNWARTLLWSARSAFWLLQLRSLIVGPI